MFHIIIADENKVYRKKIRTIFGQEGFITDQASSLEEVLGMIDKSFIDLVMIDAHLGGMSSEEIIASLREMHSDLLVVMLDDRKTPENLKNAYLAGADEYLEKNVQDEELLFRVKAILRRTGKDYQTRIVIGKVILDMDSMTVSREDEKQTLPRKEFYLLYKLLSHPEKIYTRDQLMDEIWGVTSETTQSTLNVHVNRLRKKFDSYPEFKIKAIRGIGYKAQITEE